MRYFDRYAQAVLEVEERRLKNKDIRDRICEFGADYIKNTLRREAIGAPPLAYPQGYSEEYAITARDWQQYAGQVYDQTRGLDENTRQAVAGALDHAGEAAMVARSPNDLMQVISYLSNVFREAGLVPAVNQDILNNLHAQAIAVQADLSRQQREAQQEAAAAAAEVQQMHGIPNRQPTPIYEIGSGSPVDYLSGCSQGPPMTINRVEVYDANLARAINEGRYSNVSMGATVPAEPAEPNPIGPLRIFDDTILEWSESMDLNGESRARARLRTPMRTRTGSQVRMRGRVWEVVGVALAEDSTGGPGTMWLDLLLWRAF
jgi:hypothetical protein